MEVIDQFHAPTALSIAENRNPVLHPIGYSLYGLS